MKDIFRNKRVLFALIMCFVVIAIAILVFIIIGMDSKKNKNVSVINLDNSTGNPVTNVTNTTSNDTDNGKNETTNDIDDNDNDNDNENDNDNDNDNNSDDDNNDNNGEDDDDNTEEDEINFDGEQFYLDAVNDFVEGLTSEKKMEKFIENHLDIKAYAACYNVEGSDSEFLEEYFSLDDNDDIVQSVLEKLPKIATYEEVKLIALTDPKKSGDSDEINRVILTVKADGKTEKIRMVFYGETVIYIYDDDNQSIVDLD